MKIINQGNGRKREIHCDYKNHDFECDCDFGVEFGDLIKESSKTKISEDCIEFMGSFYNFHVICPNCGNTIRIFNLPKQLFFNKMFDNPD